MADEAADSLLDIRGFNQKRGPSCKAGLMISAMDPELRRTVEQAIKDPSIERAAVVRWLEKRHDIVMSEHSFARHAAGKCRCE